MSLKSEYAEMSNLNVFVSMRQSRFSEEAGAALNVLIKRVCLLWWSPANDSAESQSCQVM